MELSREKGSNKQWSSGLREVPGIMPTPVPPEWQHVAELCQGVAGLCQGETGDRLEHQSKYGNDTP